MKNDSIILHGPVPRNSADGLADGKSGFHDVKSEWINHGDSRDQPCVRNLYKRTFDATN